MRVADFDFDLPEALIALRPARPRTAARLLLAEGERLSDRQFSDLPAILRPGDRLVLNDTRVIAARLAGHRLRGDSQARVEVTLLGPAPGGWHALARPLRKLREGDEIRFPGGLGARVLSREVARGGADEHAGAGGADTGGSPAGLHADRAVDAARTGRAGEGLLLAFNLEGADFDAALSRAGRMPLPPYIAARRPPDDSDERDYQSVFARHAGAVAAPTASLHFDESLLASLAARGVTFSHVTLHVGAGTFLPVKVEDVEAHRMHAEWGRVGAQAAAAINATRAAGGRVIPVGTTALRLIEAAASSGRVEPFEGETDIFIRPGYRFRTTDGLITNFHLPRSTLLMLVAALMGKARIDRIYAHAIAARYRFFSYGDASLLLPGHDGEGP